MQRSVLVAVLVLMPALAEAQTSLKVPFDQAVFAWTVPASGPSNSPADKHTIVCGTITVDVPMPATSKPVREVVPGVGTYSCSLYASNSFGRQSGPNIPFPTFEAGLIPLAPTNPRLEVLP